MSRTLPMSLQWTWPRRPGGGSAPTASLRITDEESATTLFEVEISAEDVARLLSSSSVDVDAEIPDLAILARLGKRLENERIPHPEGLTHHGSEPSDAMVAFAEQARQEGGWETVRWSRHNFGWALTGRRWVDAEPTA